MNAMIQEKNIIYKYVYLKKKKNLQKIADFSLIGNVSIIILFSKVYDFSLCKWFKMTW